MPLTRSLQNYEYKKMPSNIKEFIVKSLGVSETKKLMRAIRGSKWIVVQGPSTSGKTTIGEILKRIGYPYVIDADDLVPIHTSNPLTSLTSMNDIFESLGI